MGEKTANVQKIKNKKLWRMLRKPGELLPKSTLKIPRKSGSSEVKYKEMRGDSRFLHSTVCPLY